MSANDAALIGWMIGFLLGGVYGLWWMATALNPRGGDDE